MSALITIEKCPVGVMFAHIAKGRYSMEKGDHSSAKEQYENALKISIDEEDVIRQKNILSYIATMYRVQGKISKGLEVYDEAIDLHCDEGDVMCIKTTVKCLINKAYLVYEKSEYEEALQLFYTADSLMMDHGMSDSLYRVTIYNSMGNVYDKGR